MNSQCVQEMDRSMVSRRISISCVVLLAFTLLLSSCREHVADNPVPGKPPQTFLWLYPDATVGLGVSKTHLHWWGESPNGLVRGFLFSFTVVTGNVTTLPTPDTLRYTWVTTNDSTVLFPMDTLFRKFAVVVRAVDYTFRGLPEQSIVRLLPFPFWDKSDNGVFDGADSLLDGLSKAIDPVGAVQTFPIRNTPPTIALLANPNDLNAPQKLPDTTFTVATVGFKGSDQDGDNTLASYSVALNDTSASGSWVDVSLRDTVITLVVPRVRSDGATTTVTADLYGGTFLGRRPIGQLPNLRLNAENVLYVKAKDVAGEYSPALRLPGVTERWYVKRPQGRVLLVSDYIAPDAQQARTTYLASLTSPSGAGISVDVLNIGAGLSASDKSAGKFGPFVPQFVDPALIQTFLLFDYVVWYTDQLPGIGVAQKSIFPYLQNGGRVIFATTFLTTVDSRGGLRDFAPIDSVSSVNLSPSRPLPPPAALGDSQIPAHTIVYPDSSEPANIYPLLAFDSARPLHGIFMRPLYKRSDSRYLYRLQQDSMTVVRTTDNVVLRAGRQNYLGSPNIAVMDGQQQIIFIGLPLHLLDNTALDNTNVAKNSGAPSGLAAFFKKAFSQFRPTQVVNRMVF
jgi:hypothetical protein